MTWEEVWYASYRHGRRPTIHRLSDAASAEPSAALRLAWHIHTGASGYRPVTLRRWPLDPIYFWERPGGQWWVIPRRLAAQAQRLAQRRGATAWHDFAAAEIEQRLRDLGEIVTVMDSRITPVLGGQVRLPRPVRDRMSALLAARNVCDDAGVPQISCRVIELCRDFALGRGA